MARYAGEASTTLRMPCRLSAGNGSQPVLLSQGSMPHRFSRPESLVGVMVEQKLKETFNSTNSIAYSTPMRASEKSGHSTNAGWKREEPWIRISADELGRALGELSKQAGRLAQLVQSKMKCRIPSEAFDHLLTERMEEVSRSFDMYILRKQELLTCIKATAAKQEKVSQQQCLSAAESNRELR